MKRIILPWFCLALALASISAPAQAAVFYTTIDPATTTYTAGSTSSGYNVLRNPPGSPAGSYNSYAYQFVPSASFTLTRISFGVQLLSSPNGTTYGDLNAYIYLNDPATSTPLVASPLANGAIVAPAASATVPLTTFTYTGTTLTLSAGQAYWLALLPARDGSDVNWGGGTNSTTGPLKISTDGTTYTNASPFNGSISSVAFRIEGNAVPEPSAWAGIIVGALGLVLSQRVVQKRRQTA